MCIKNNQVYYLSKTIPIAPYEPPKIVVYKHPTIEEFAEKLDILSIGNFIVSYLKQSNIKTFGYIILNVVTEFVNVYKERDIRTTDKEFCEKISPTLGDFLLYDCLIAYTRK